MHILFSSMSGVSFFLLKMFDHILLNTCALSVSKNLSYIYRGSYYPCVFFSHRHTCATIPAHIRVLACVYVLPYFRYSRRYNACICMYVWILVCCIHLLWPFILGLAIKLLHCIVGVYFFIVKSLDTSCIIAWLDILISRRAFVGNLRVNIVAGVYIIDIHISSLSTLSTISQELGE